MMTRAIGRAALGCAAAAGALLAAPPAHAQRSRDIYVENACAHPLRLIVSHAPTVDSWDPHGWYEFEANEEPIQLLDNDEPLIQLDDHALFIYGETTDGSEIYWEGDDYDEEFYEVNYGMMRAVLEVESGHFVVRLQCDDL